MFPDTMDAWPASDRDGLRESLTKAAAADIFVGILGVRYGHIPDTNHRPAGVRDSVSGARLPARSIAELEYDRAPARGIPRLMFLIDEGRHQIVLRDVETGPGADS